ncbi:MAG TPA: metal-dependent transcriptional regulator, partial [Candidatus Desulfofervidus auxilii]|nr:metal-dependent transcriptional regulator [Candidatus Desulfofervidus auxilii]
MPRTKKLTESAEDCLEAIYVLSKTKKVVRVKDIAKHLDTKMASIVVGLKTLA